MVPVGHGSPGTAYGPVTVPSPQSTSSTAVASTRSAPNGVCGTASTSVVGACDSRYDAHPTSISPGAISGWGTGRVWSRHQSSTHDVGVIGSYPGHQGTPSAR